ncbi:MAG TPA: MFS transporter [Verrucomicrobiae bacterium]|jgi:MFS family permease
MSDSTPAARMAWTQVVLASVLMLATLPGRTQGLGLITEPLLADLRLDRVTYANLNLWATLLGALVCFPAGWAIDRFGLRWVTATVLLLLGLAVWKISVFTGGIALLFALLLATRAFGQSALSVCSITLVGKWFRQRVGVAMGIYSVLLSVFFAASFGLIGYSIRENGWRTAWLRVAMALLFVITPLVLLALREPGIGRNEEPASPPERTNENDDSRRELSLGEALRTRAFWVFAGAAALFNLVSSGLGLFNESILAERGFERATFHHFLIVTTLLSLAGQFACGWLSTRWKFQTLTFIALALYAIGLAAIPLTRGPTELWMAAVLVGSAGGMIIVIFFSVWSEIFGQRHLGKIQGAAQMLTVISSALGPVLFAQSHKMFSSYTPLLCALAATVAILAAIAALLKFPHRARFNENR